jgi:Tfp pilus assembly protein PilX
MKRYKYSDNDQKGFAAIVVALVMVIVLSLITVGFAQLMQTNLNEALNKQLSSQAYYAAESGVNDAYEAYIHGYLNTKSNCGQSGISTSNPASSYLLQPNVNTTTNTSITCLLMNPEPQQLVYSDITNNQATVIEMQGCSTTGSPSAPCEVGLPTPISSINISWNNNQGYSNPVTNCSEKLYPATSWTYQNMLRIELIPLSVNDTRLTRHFLTNNSFSAFLCPVSNGSGSITLSQSSATSPGNMGLFSGKIYNGSCTSTSCSISLQVGGLLDQSSQPYGAYLLVVRSVYPNTSGVYTSITLNNNLSGQLNIADGQLLVDSTGKAQNAQKRIQVRIPETNQYYYPVAAIEGEVCKQLNLLPSPGQSTDETPSSSLCHQFNN